MIARQLSEDILKENESDGSLNKYGIKESFLKLGLTLFTNFQLGLDNLQVVFLNIFKKVSRKNEKVISFFVIFEGLSQELNARLIAISNGDNVTSKQEEQLLKSNSNSNERITMLMAACQQGLEHDVRSILKR